MTTTSTDQVPLTDTRPEAPQGASGCLRFVVLLTALFTATCATAVALQWGGAVDIVELPGLSTADPTVAWTSGFLKLAGNLAAVAAVGLSMAAAFFISGRENAPTRLTAQGWQWMRMAAAAAIAWGIILLIRVPVDYADTFARPLGEVTTEGAWSYATQSDQGQTLLLAAALALVAGILAATALSVSGAVWTALIALAAALPPVFTGHSASSGNHQIAIDSMLLHVIGAVLWTGGLLALFLARAATGKAPTTTGKQRRQRAIPLHLAARRYSHLALLAFSVVAVSGIINFIAREPLESLLTSSYGAIATGKIVLMAACGYLGWWHRRRTLPQLRAGKPRAFARLAGVELVIMAATFGLASALALTPPPGDDTGTVEATTALLGYSLDEPFRWSAVATTWYPNIMFCFLALIAVGSYLAGVRRLRKRGDTWSGVRTWVWIAGWALIVFATSSGIGKYAMAMFSVHMVQHMALNMAGPILIVLGAPTTLALRALRPNVDRGPREWLLSILHSKWVKAISQPLVALAIYMSSLYVMYLTPMFEWAMDSHVGHTFMLLHFLAAGCLFFWVIIGPDPKPRDVSYPAKILIFFISLVFHAIFGLTLMMTTSVIAEPWYTALALEWNADLLDDQQTGGGIAWAFGEVPSLFVLAALVAQWSKSEEREARRIDRVAQRAQESDSPEDDPHEVYNAYLARLAEEDRKRAEAGQ
ncbi:cytochrome c oxidase assembly protein [Natronoglycomyces albus]|uniref:Bifunctional copper resistance protein CopD/cytochrome c oxidase assembly protein n=1 Tax=Natronoglycomyces albus TaxID=2811108 RepID=A0A895XTF5_9ACTN|nr:cytochrome c oxidase assembly protein [Natronoglycomyces albus]QSB05540.1 bifunctional copper resistance protein CopD/cytochrome c oxidase assembly protein [Natronoglycomyces albus]